MVVIECDGETIFDEPLEECHESVEVAISARPDKVDQAILGHARGRAAGFAEGAGWKAIGTGAEEVNLCPICYKNYPGLTD